MDLKYGSPARSAFVSNVGLITSNGPFGHNIMAAEWTFQISYDPGLIIVSVGPNKATNANIKESKFFGVSIAASDQNVLSSVAGGSSGKEFDKIATLKELGFSFSRAKGIDVLLVDGAVLWLECSLVEQKEQGDHTVFIGKVDETVLHEGKEPLVYHLGRYWEIGKEHDKPALEERDRMKSVLEKFRKQ